MSLVPTNARVTIVRMSSLPLPQRIQSGSTPNSSPARMRNAVASGSGYFCSPACTTRPIAAFTFGEHWYGFSFVLSLMNFSPRGCSPGT